MEPDLLPHEAMGSWLRKRYRSGRLDRLRYRDYDTAMMMTTMLIVVGPRMGKVA